MFEFNIEDKGYSHIHFIGIGGISMSGLAEILLSKNYTVSGSDIQKNKIVNRLEKLGAKIYIGQVEENIEDDVDLIIYTDAIRPDNEELIAAKEKNIPLVDRATFLGALMRNYQDAIAVSGTHGKTTTTSIISTILSHSNINPTILLGGQLKEIGGNVKLGSHDCLLTEACEYKGNILKYFPSMAIIMNMDEDHLDYFKSIDHIVDTFSTFASNLKEDGCLIINNDDKNKDRVIKSTKAKVLTFGLKGNPNYLAENIETNGHKTNFDLYLDGKFIDVFTINIIGNHNVYNSLAAIAACHNFGLSLEFIKKNISMYTGVERRLEFKGYYDGVKILDDYAHHPTEIKVTLKALKNSTKNGEVYCIFQPHTFTRTQKLFNSFKEAFNYADHVIVTDIYAARELDDGSVHSQDLVSAITNTDARYISSFGEIKDFLLDTTNSGDVIVTMGAGNIYELGEEILKNSLEAI